MTMIELSYIHCSLNVLFQNIEFSMFSAQVIYDLSLQNILFTVKHISDYA